MKESINFVSGKEKLIVMPFQPGPGQEPDGTGLGVHFLLGNLFCLHPGLLECWFGWRVKKIFSDPLSLTSYSMGNEPFQDIGALGSREKVRFWMEGMYWSDLETVRIEAVLHDTRGAVLIRSGFTLDCEDGCLGFRKDFFDWLGNCGLGCDRPSPAFWPEKITLAGLDSLGRALEILYMNYVDGSDAPIDLARFEKAATLCPKSYLCQDLLGWGLYKNDQNHRAAEAFAKAVALNPDGMGALAGLMWCALAEQDREKTLGYALEKGRCRGEDPAKARAFVEKKFS